MTDEIVSDGVSPQVEKAEIARIKAETKKLLAEAKHEDIQTEVQTAQLRFVQAEAERAEINLTERRIESARVLAHDVFHHVIRFSQEITPASVHRCIDELTIWRRTSEGEPIEIIFNSPGGSIFSGMDLFDYIQELRHDGHHITTSARGMAASMAAILLQAGDHRVIGKETAVLLHEPSTLALGTIGVIEDELALLRRVQDRVLTLFAARSADAMANGTADVALTREQFEHGDVYLGIPGWHRKEWWLDSTECLKYGIVDEVR